MNENTQTKLTYRQAQSSDAPLLIKLYNAAFYADYIRYGECPAYGRSVEAMEKSIADYPKIIILYNKIPVGVISAQNNNGNVYLGCLCVLPEYQRMKIGTAAIKKLEEAYPERKSITLITPADNSGNIRFYTLGCGFRIVSEEMDGNVKVVKLVKKSDNTD